MTRVLRNSSCCDARIVASVVVALTAATASGARIYVDAAATGSGSGADWTNARTSLQSAISVASSGDEIWVAAGTYKPSALFCVSCGTPGARHATFLLPDGVKIYGGFLGTAHPSGGETDLDARDPEVYETILSGDIGTADDPSDNAYHVVTAYDVGETTKLSGFTIRDGNADGTNEAAVGAGVLAAFTSASEPSAPQITRCRIVDNTADDDGAGAYVFGVNSESGTTRFVNCTFSGNEAGGDGSALYVFGSSDGVTVQVTNCAFHDNTATGAGTLFVTTVGLVSVINCTFAENRTRRGLSNTAVVRNANPIRSR